MTIDKSKSRYDCQSISQSVGCGLEQIMGPFPVSIVTELPV